MKTKRYDYGAFLWKVDSLGSRTSFCEKVGVTPVTFRNYINGNTSMPSTFIEKSCEILSIPKEEIGLYFFRCEVD